jgi:hypothetical protein
MVIANATFSIFQNVQIVTGTQPVSSSMGNKILSWSLSGRDLLDTRSRLANEWSYPSTPPICLPGMARNKLTFLSLSGATA